MGGERRRGKISDDLTRQGKGVGARHTEHLSVAVADDDPQGDVRQGLPGVKAQLEPQGLLAGDGGVQHVEILHLA